MRIVTFKLEEDLLERLDKYARNKGKTRSEVIRRALELYLMMEDHREPLRTKKVRIFF